MTGSANEDSVDCQLRPNLLPIQHMIDMSLNGFIHSGIITYSTNVSRAASLIKNHSEVYAKIRYIMILKSKGPRFLAVINRILSELELMFRRPPKQQFGALCYRQIEGGGPSDIEVLLITSRETGRWVIPKGWPMGSKKSHAVAEREAFEEAGVKGKADKESFGSYMYDKVMPGGMKVPCEVKVYLLRVQEMLENYPEKGTRRLEWVSCEEAAERVREPQLKRLFHLLSLSRKRDAVKMGQAR